MSRTSKKTLRLFAKSKKRQTFSPATRLARICELLERRELLTASPAFLQGLVADTANNPLAGATVTLYQHGNDTVSGELGSATTLSDGRYLFASSGTAATDVAIVPTLLTGAQYDLIETPPAGYANLSTQSFTQVGNVVGPATSGTTANSFDVNLPQSAAVDVNVQNTFGPSGFYNNWDVVSWQDGTYNPITKTYSYADDPNSPSTYLQFPATVNGNSFLTLCTNNQQNLVGPADNTFSVLPTSSFPGAYSARIAYLYEKYGVPPNTPLDGQDAVGLQMAIDVLLYDAGGNLDTGSFTPADFNTGSTLTTQTYINPARVPGYSGEGGYSSATFADEESQAASYINESFGKTGQAWYLPVDTGAPISNGDQSLIGTDTFNFTNIAAPTITTTPGGTVSIGNITISGTKYLDLTGNGFSADDTPDKGVTINLYQETNSTAGLQTGSGGDKLVATTTTADDGSYSFGVTAAGTYYVQEAVPATDVQTGGGPNGSAGNTYYTVAATDGHSYSGYNFDDFQVPICTETDISYKVTTPSGSSTNVSDLAGHTAPGDTVTVTFTVPSGANDTLTLVSYYAQSATFSNSNAQQQLIYQQDTGTFAPGGPYSLTVQIPNSYYQIDFVCGQAISQLEPNQNSNAYGPDSAEILYHAEQRFISSDSGGSTAGTLNTASPIVPAPTTTTSTATAPLTDSATLSGGYNPGGTITFYLFAPGVTPLADNSNNVYSDQVTVSGNGSYDTSIGAHPGGYTATIPGTYQWVAVYSGDSNNTGATSPFGSEPETVGPSTPAINTTPSVKTIIVGPGEYATIGFWHNNNGQAVINDFDSGPSSTLLGMSLATNYPNLFGTPNPYTSATLASFPGSPTTFNGLTNSQVATVYENLWTPSGLQKNTYVQAFAAAFGGYTSSGSATFNVGGNGAAFGVANNTSLSVATVLQDVANNFNPTTGLFYGGDSTLTSDANNVLNGINTSGENGGGSTVSVTYLNDSATLSGGDNETGTVTFYLFAPGVTPNGTDSNNVYADTVTVSGDGTYTTTTMGNNSGGYLPTATGTYQWVAVYSGDSNNAGVTSPFGSEPWTVGTQSPLITTNAGGAVVLGSGAALTDSATLSNGDAPTGTITFYLFAPGVTPNGTDSNNVYADVVNVNSGNGTYTTAQGNNPGGYAPVVTGTYEWLAVYSGDTNNDATASNFGDEPEKSTPAGPSINTKPGGTVSMGNITIGGTKYLDLTGNGFSSDDKPYGGVKINLYQDTLDTGVLQAGDALVGTTTTAADGSFSFGVSTPGTYFVQEVVPTGYLQTGGGPDGSAGNTYYTVQVTAGSSYSGYNFDDYQIPTCAPTNVCYTIKTPSGCTTTVSTLAGNTAPGDTVTVNFTVPSGMNDTLTLVSYYAQSTSFTSSNGYQQLIYQQASGNFAPGTHSLTVKIPNSYYQIDFVCGLAIDQLEPDQNNNAYGPDSGEILYHAEGRYIDSDSGGSTPGTINSKTPTVPAPTTSPSTATQALTDSATLSGGYSATGTITFYLFAPGVTPNGSDSNNVYSDVVTVSGNGTYTTSQGNNPGGYLPTVAGTYQWVAVYSGDSNNSGATSPFGSEPETVSPTGPSITTKAQGAVVVGSGNSLADSATLTGGNGPTGSVTFYLLPPGSTAGTPLSSAVYTDTLTVNGDGTYDTGGSTTTGSAVPTMTGSYEWVAVYSGDSNNTGASSAFGDEPENATPASPSINTTPGGTVSLGNMTIGGTKYLDLTGNGFSADDTPQGGVTVNLYADTKGSGVLQAGDALVATTTTTSDGSFSFGVPTAGTYFVQESVPTGYVQTGGGPNGSAGDTYYTVVATSGNSYSGYNFDDYQVPNCPVANISYKVTTPSGCSTTVSSLAGNTAPGDTVTVTFTVPSGSTETLTLASYYAQSSSFSSSNGYLQSIYQQDTQTFGSGQHSLTVKIPNTYYQIDFVCGLAIDQLQPDQNNNAYGPDSGEILYHAEGRYIDSDSGGSTAGTINTKTPTVPAPTTSPSTATQVLTDSAMLSGGYSPGGTITFYLFAPGVTPNGSDSNNVYSYLVTVSGNGTYTTSQGNNPGGYLPTVAGTYQWVAVYSGDTNNNGVTSPFGSEPEHVGPTSSSITTTPGGTVVLGCSSTLTDSATLAGGVNPTGTITFYLFAPGVTPNGSDSNNVFSNTVTVNGNGTYATSKGYVPTVAGTYQWVAVYSGDCNNMPLVSKFGDEPETVTASQAVSSDEFATIGFWHNKNGQAVIDSFNGGSSETDLGNWLASNFPHLFGASNPYTHTSLAGLTNAQVAYVYEHLWNPSGVTKNTYVQAFAVALGMYADDGTLGYDSTAHTYGFTEVSGGGENATYNVGSNGAAFGVANDTTLTVLQLLQIADSNFDSSSGTFSGDTSEFNNVLNGINSSGDIRNAATVGAPAAGSGAVVYSSDQIRTAYGVNNLSLDGTGQTIAIVDAYDDPAIFQSVDSFDQQMSATTGGASLFTQYGSAASFLTVIGQNGGSTLPATDPTGAWETEIALDVEWIHAMAPGAQIILVEANSQSLGDLMASVGTAASQPGVSVVSMSWGFTEGQSVLAADEAQYDGYLTTPAGHQGVTFVASTGDYGAANPEYPAFSPNVVAVGGTSLYLNADNSYKNETGWGYYSNSLGVAIGGGGGVSLYEPEPAFQQGAQSTGFRTTPDVSMVADPATGVWLADSYNLDPSNPWEVVGGTSLAAPSWAALIALADAARVAAGGQTLGSAGPTETQQALYTLPTTDFNAVTTGSNGYSAGPGYNLVGGLGTPVGNLLIPDLAAYAGSTAVPAGRIALSSAEATLSDTNFGATNALTGVANAFAVVNVLVMDGSVAEHFPVGSQYDLFAAPASASSPSSPTASPLSAGSKAGDLGFSPIESVVDAVPGESLTTSMDTLGAPASGAVSTFLSTGTSGMRRSWLGGPLDADLALDSLFGGDGADLATEGEESSGDFDLGVGKARPFAPSAAKSRGDDVSRSAQESAAAGRGGSSRHGASVAEFGFAAEGSARASSPLAGPSSEWSTALPTEPASEMTGSVTGEPIDEIVAVVEGMAGKSAEAVSRAYESLVDAVFGLIG